MEGRVDISHEKGIFVSLHHQRISEAGEVRDSFHCTNSSEHLHIRVKRWVGQRGGERIELSKGRVGGGELGTMRWRSGGEDVPRVVKTNTRKGGGVWDSCTGGLSQPSLHTLHANLDCVPRRQILQFT